LIQIFSSGGNILLQVYDLWYFAEPLDIWGKSFSFCIWQIGLHGTTNSDVVKRNVTYYNKVFWMMT